MSDIYSILANAYKAAAPTSPTLGPYKNVDPTAYEGNWSGTYDNNQKFQITISQVNGFRARVEYQSGSTRLYQQVLISNNSFRIGDTKFVLGNTGTAQVGTVVTSPVDGSTTLLKGSATQTT
jgi:hypothetical protein